MTAQKEYFIYLLSCFLSGDTPQGREVDFEELYRLADIHDVTGIIATQLKCLPKEFQPLGEIRSHFIQNIGLTLREYQRKEVVQNTVGELLEALKIQHLFVKGAVINAYYPSKELRTSGDIDVILDNSAYPKLLDYARQHGDSVKIMEYTTHVLVLRIGGVDVEFHDNADVGLAYFDDIFSLCERVEGYRAVLPDRLHLLYIIAHLAKHIAYRGAGIRMLMDVDVMVRHMQPFDLEDFLLLCDEAGIRKTAEALFSLCRLWFKTPIDAFVDFSDNASLLNSFEHVLLDGGSFGYEENAVPVRYMENSGGVLAGVKVLLKMAFPSREYLKKCYPYYAAHPILLPVARLNRLFDGLFKKRRQTVGAVRQINNGNGNSAYQLALIQELEISFNK